MPTPQIPRAQSENQDVTSLQTNILQVINPILKSNPILFGTTLKNVQLNVGDTTLTTGLTQSIIGWIVIRKRGPASIYDNQDTNMVAGTLILNSDVAVSVDLLVF